MKDLQKYPRFRELESKLLDLWSRAVHQPGYDRHEWSRLKELVELVARHGLGGENSVADDDPTPVDTRRAVLEGSVNCTTWVQIYETPSHVPMPMRELNLGRFLWLRTVIKDR